MNGLLQQARGMSLNRAAVGRSLTGKLGLNFGSDVNEDGHDGLDFSLRSHPHVSGRHGGTQPILRRKIETWIGGIVR